MEYTPTHLILTNYYTKPLSGSLFKEMREYIMWWRPIKDLIHTKDVRRIKEDVGN